CRASAITNQHIFSSLSLFAAIAQVKDGLRMLCPFDCIVRKTFIIFCLLLAGVPFIRVASHSALIVSVHRGSGPAGTAPSHETSGGKASTVDSFGLGPDPVGPRAPLGSAAFLPNST